MKTISCQFCAVVAAVLICLGLIARVGAGNTFNSEIDVIDSQSAPAPTTAEAAADPIRIEGNYLTIDVTNVPDLKDWAQKSLLPKCEEWYPQIAEMLASDGYTAPTRVTIRFRDDMKGTPAWANGDGVSCNAEWFRKNVKGQGVGAVIHELTHVVQHYRGDQSHPNPGWLVEGIADYVRWYKFEPQLHGAEIRNAKTAKYDASYRVTANFLNWVTKMHDEKIVQKLNAAMREAKYSDDLWKQYTGKTAAELGEEWKQTLSR